MVFGVLIIKDSPSRLLEDSTRPGIKDTTLDDCFCVLAGFWLTMTVATHSAAMSGMNGRTTDGTAQVKP